MEERQIRFKVGLNTVDKKQLESLFDKGPEWKKLITVIIESTYNQAYNLGYADGKKVGIASDGEEWKQTE